MSSLISNIIATKLIIQTNLQSPDVLILPIAAGDVFSRTPHRRACHADRSKFAEVSALSSSAQARREDVNRVILFAVVGIIEEGNAEDNK